MKEVRKRVIVTPPQAIFDDEAIPTTVIDTLGFARCEIDVIIGAIDAAGLTTLAVQESDDSGSGYANITGAIFGTSENIDGDTSALPADANDDTIFSADIDLRGRKRYLDVNAVAGNGTAGAFVAIIAHLSRAEEAPDTVAETGCQQFLSVGG